MDNITLAQTNQAPVSEGRIEELLRPYLDAVPGAPEPFDRPFTAVDGLSARLVIYLELLLKWNARTNLSAIRDPEQIVRRNFGESLFLARALPDSGTVLDYGSGAGFPGIPVQLLHPRLQVTLAESQNKKVAFLREAVRRLDIASRVAAGRVTDTLGATCFDYVVLRAVDSMDLALEEAGQMAARGVIVLGSSATEVQIRRAIPGVTLGIPIPLPHSDDGRLWIAEKTV